MKLTEVSTHRLYNAAIILVDEIRPGPPFPFPLEGLYFWIPMKYNNITMMGGVAVSSWVCVTRYTVWGREGILLQRKQGGVGRPS